MKKKKKNTIVVILVIQKLIFQTRASDRYSINGSICLPFNKDLSFFLLKKKLFLYKSFFPKRLGKVALPKPKNSVYSGPNNFYGNLLSSLASRVRSDNILLRSSSKKFTFYRIKKKFNAINKVSRSYFFKNMGYKMFPGRFSEFFLLTKNFEKKRLFIQLVSKSFFGGNLLSFLLKSNKFGINSGFIFFCKQNSVSSSILSKRFQMFLLSKYTIFLKKKISLINKDLVSTFSSKKILNNHRRILRRLKKKRVHRRVMAKFRKDNFYKVPSQAVGLKPLLKKRVISGLYSKKLQIVRNNMVRPKSKFHIHRRIRKFLNRIRSRSLSHFRYKKLVYCKKSRMVYKKRDLNYIKKKTYSAKVADSLAAKVGKIKSNIPIVSSKFRIFLGRRRARNKKGFRRRVNYTGLRSLLKIKNFTKKKNRFFIKKTRSLVNRKIKNGFNTKQVSLLTTNRFFDPRQLIEFPFKGYNPVGIDYSRLNKVNFFNFRSYNWGIIT